MSKIILLLLLMVTLVNCDTKTPEFFYTQNKLKYQYHDVSDLEQSPAIGDYLTVYLQYKNSKDSIFYDSQKSTYLGTDIIYLGNPSVEGGIEEGFAQLQLGDSVTFFIEKHKFFDNYLKREIPSFLTNEIEIKITLRLLKIESPKEYNTRITAERLAAEAIELQTLESIVKEWQNSNDTIYEYGGIFLTNPDTTCTEKVKGGDFIKIKYKGYFPDGKVFYDNTQGTQFDEFKVGQPGQTIEGLKIALLHLCYGQQAKVLVPSMLGFNESVIQQGIIPAYTPVIFEITNIEKNN